MPYIPHTEEEVQQMLAQIGVSHVDELFSEIPKELLIGAFKNIPEGLSELEMTQSLEARFEKDVMPQNYAGAGSYEHHIPAAVWDLVMRGEYLTAYTPYQAEASQGTLQLLWEYQTMMASLMGHDVSNASLYDGATALTEAILMAIRHARAKQPVIYLPESVHPFYRETVHGLLKNQGFEIVSVPYDVRAGHITEDALERVWQKTKQCTALIIPAPNFFGILEDVSKLTDWVHSKGGMAIGCVNPMSMALLKPPGQWGTKGADIACGEGQPLGVPMNRGGPYFGFLTCKQSMVRQLPGRIVGATTDAQGRRGFTLTLQAREQHIRRGKATSNICTNQGLLVTAATIYMSLMGPDGLQNIAKRCHERTKKLAQSLKQIKGVKIVFDRNFFHEIVIQLSCPTSEVIDAMLKKNLLAGVNISEMYPELDNTLLVCVTETKTDQDIQDYTMHLESVLRGAHG